jgi:hypothetical protein
VDNGSTAAPAARVIRLRPGVATDARPDCYFFFACLALMTRNAPRMNGWMRQKYV